MRSANVRDGYYTIEEAAQVIATQEQWSDAQRDTLIKQMMDAARDGTLVVRHPHTYDEYQPETVRQFYELLDAQDFNKWATERRLPYRFPAPDDAHAETSNLVAPCAREHSVVNYPQYLGNTLWTLWEGCCLCFEVDPETHDLSNSVESLIASIQPEAIRNNFKLLYRDAKHATKKGYIEFTSGSDITRQGQRITDPYTHRLITPMEFLTWAADWAARRSVDLPAEFLDFIEKARKPNDTVENTPGTVAVDLH